MEGRLGTRLQQKGWSAEIYCKKLSDIDEGTKKEHDL